MRGADLGPHRLASFCGIPCNFKNKTEENNPPRPRGKAVSEAVEPGPHAGAEHSPSASSGKEVNARRARAARSARTLAPRGPRTAKLRLRKRRQQRCATAESFPTAARGLLPCLTAPSAAPHTAAHSVGRSCGLGPSVQPILKALAAPSQQQEGTAFPSPKGHRTSTHF